MSYFRVYPSKNNSIFRYITVNGSTTTVLSDTINTGANTTMELQDGKGQSKLIFEFELPTWLKTKITDFSFTAKLQLFDAGTLFNPPIKLKNVKLTSFPDAFVEGDGFSFLKPEHKTGVSNWLNRDSVNLWSAVTFTTLTTYHLNSINEDLNFDITTSIADFIDDNIIPKYALEIDNREQDNNNVYTKFLYSRHTRTVFKPYIEFFIDDEIVDKTYNCIAEQANKIYLINELGTSFTGAVTTTLSYETGVPLTPTVTEESTGIYSITITPPALTTINKTYATLIWSIGGIAVKKEMISIKTPNQITEGPDLQNLFFYSTTPSTHNIIRQGDILPFTVISQIRGREDIVTDTYEYKITSADGFEMTPWTKVSVYKNKMFFYVNTEYFYPEQQYEVWIRNKTNTFTITSNLTYKFKLAQNEKSHLRDQAASPYFSREQYFSK